MAPRRRSRALVRTGFRAHIVAHVRTSCLSSAVEAGLAGLTPCRLRAIEARRPRAERDRASRGAMAALNPSPNEDNVFLQILEAMPGVFARYD